eukprot:gene7345-biopygen21038
MSRRRDILNSHTRSRPVMGLSWSRQTPVSATPQPPPPRRGAGARVALGAIPYHAVDHAFLCVQIQHNSRDRTATSHQLPATSHQPPPAKPRGEGAVHKLLRNGNPDQRAGAY